MKLILGYSFLGDPICLQCTKDKLNATQRKHSKPLTPEKECSKAKYCVYCGEVLEGEKKQINITDRS